MLESSPDLLPCSVPGCVKPAAFEVVLLRPYVAKNRIIDILTRSNYPGLHHPQLCHAHAAEDLLYGDRYTEGAKIRAVTVYLPLSKDALTKTLLRHLPTLPKRTKRTDFAAYQKRLWNTFNAVDLGMHYEEFRLALRDGKLDALVKTLDLELPVWCEEDGCSLDAVAWTSEGEKLCVLHATRRRAVQPSLVFTKLPAAERLSPSLFNEVFGDGAESCK